MSDHGHQQDQSHGNDASDANEVNDANDANDAKDVAHELHEQDLKHASENKDSDTSDTSQANDPHASLAHHHGATSTSPPMDIPIPNPITIPNADPDRFPTAEQVRHVSSLHAPSSPTTALLAAFRTQIANLSDQSNHLNAKLIQALTDRADLEDAHILLESEHSALKERAAALQRDKERWEESMNTGLLVERVAITAEMQKLASGLVEEERRRGSAEERRQQVENELDDLAATLFDQANTMVATERMAKTQAEERLKRTEENLAAAESAMRDMQLHLQSMTNPSIASPKPGHQLTVDPPRYLSSHLPYTEFLSFIDALHNLRPLKNARKSAFPPPAISSYLTHPFVHRIIVEDHEPTIRLDSAPTLSYFSRRNVGPAIIAGELVIEPVSASTILNSTTTPAHDIGCALCGKPVFPSNVPQSPATSHFGPQLAHPHPTTKQSRFSLKPFFNAGTSGSPVASSNASPSASPLTSPSVGVHTIGSTSFPSVYVFRVATSAGSDKEAKHYPLCKTGWCLERLRAACELWHFVRTGIIHVVWNGDDGWSHPLERHQSTPRPLDNGPHASGSVTPQGLVGGERTVSGTSTVSNASSSATSGATSADPSVQATAPTAVDSIIATDKAEVKKSGGWGLGFKFGRSGSSLDTEVQQQTKGSEKLGLDPPVEIVRTESPVGEGERAQEHGAVSKEGEGEGESEKKVGEKGEKKGGEEGEGEKKAGEEETDGVPSIEKQDVSPVASGQDGGAEIPRNVSSTSIASSGGGDFSTPKGQAAELPEDDDEKNAGGEEVELNSPDASGTPVAPPPLPRRASGRGAVPPKTPIESETPETVPEPESASDIEAVKGASHAQSTETENEAGGLGGVPSQPPRAPPPLPPRHPQTPVLSSARDRLARAGVDGEKRWLDTEGGWEERTWRQVVLLKQGMFKARVGVFEGGGDE